MMAKGNVTLRDYTEEGLRDPQVLALADRIVYRPGTPGPLPAGGDSGVSRPAVEIRLKDGRVLSRTAAGVPGDPRNPVNRELLEAKFRDCVSFAAQPLAASEVERALGLIAELEHLSDVTEVMRLLTPREGSRL